ncbi:MAG: hypothetical protein G01um101419_536 [Parcubacteria group bacterium Gr01-1014_19]|nr:MAG: hypothetical protein G01um101419_536 [Parcubacteria group bacterium Gr01-1014_19]
MTEAGKLLIISPVPFKEKAVKKFAFLFAVIAFGFMGCADRTVSAPQTPAKQDQPNNDVDQFGFAKRVRGTITAVEFFPAKDDAAPYYEFKVAYNNRIGLAETNEDYGQFLRVSDTVYLELAGVTPSETDAGSYIVSYVDRWNNAMVTFQMPRP